MPRNRSGIIKDPRAALPRPRLNFDRKCLFLFVADKREIADVERLFAVEAVFV
ncbi:MAG: hypothetical protein R6V61_08455 [Wenzhouxiangellaceae bacterium]